MMETFEPTAKILADSAHLHGRHRLITIETLAPKFLDAEIEKHRMLSSNSSSDRATPFNTLVSGPIYIPTDIRVAGSDMQQEEQVSEETRKAFQNNMEALFWVTVGVLRHWAPKIHKQHINRYLLAWSPQRKVITGTINWWEYFLGLRMNSAADPAMQQLAAAISKAISDSKPTCLNHDEWHLPYIPSDFSMPGIVARRVSAARCARVSYNAHDGQATTIEEDLALASKLLANRHMTPFEHQATPTNLKDHPMSANLSYWIQYRQQLDAQIKDSV